MSKEISAAILGASGYTGAEAVRLLARHPKVHVGPLTANAQAGRALGELFPHLHTYSDRPLVKAEDVDWADVDVAFGCLPHGASQETLLALPSHVRIIDLSADFRFRDVTTYEAVYDRKHIAPQKTADAVYGLTEFARDALKGAPLIACPGCYPTATLLALLPLAQAGLIIADDIIVDAKSGVSGAGRSLKEANLFCEAAEGLHAYSVGNHRHAPEIEQELAFAFGVAVTLNFTPHLVPMVRGELVTCHVKLAQGTSVDDAREALRTRYADEPFVSVAAPGASPDTRWVRGSNLCVISIFADRIPGRAIIVAVIDNITKGSSGQAVQNLNVAMGWDEALGLQLEPLFP